MLHGGFSSELQLDARRNELKSLLFERGINMGKYTKEDILRIAREQNVRFVRLQFTDILGCMKNVAITSSQLEKALDNRCMFVTYLSNRSLSSDGISTVAFSS